MKIREMLVRDWGAIHNILVESRVFTPKEVVCATELIDIYLNVPDQQDYRINCAVNEKDEAIGYVCFGKTPLTDAVYDLYWIAISPQFQRQGVGQRLLEFVEDSIKREGARMLVIETSFQAKYTKTRNFYLKNRYKEVAIIRDFYAVGDAKIIYKKEFT